MTTDGPFARKIRDHFGPETDNVEALAWPLGSVPGLVLGGGRPPNESRDTASDSHRSTCASDSYRLGSTSDKSTATPKPLRFNVEIQTDPVEEEEEKGVEKRETTDSRETFASARDQSSPVISRGPTTTNDKRDGDQSSSTNSNDSVGDIPAGAEAAWKPAMNSTELVRATSQTPALGETFEEIEEAVMRRLELTIEEIWWEMEDSDNTHRRSDDGPQNDP